MVKGGSSPPSGSDAAGALDAGRLPSTISRPGQGRLDEPQEGQVLLDRYVSLPGWVDYVGLPGPALAVWPAGGRPLEA